MIESFKLPGDTYSYSEYVTHVLTSRNHLAESELARELMRGLRGSARVSRALRVEVEYILMIRGKVYIG